MKSTGPLLHSIFQALSDPYRLRIVALMLNSRTEMCLCELSDSLEEPEYKLSRHIKVLKSAGLIGSERQGKWIYHSLHNDQRFQKMLYETIKSFPKLGAEFDKDLRRFDKRRLLRENGRCQMPIRTFRKTVKNQVVRL